MAKTLKVDIVEVTMDGTVQIRFNKYSSDGDFIGYHRTSIPADVNPLDQIAAVNNHLGKEGFAALDVTETDRVNNLVSAIRGV